jgi:hypothetical protein
VAVDDLARHRRLAGSYARARPVVVALSPGHRVAGSGAGRKGCAPILCESGCPHVESG